MRGELKVAMRDAGVQPQRSQHKLAARRRVGRFLVSSVLAGFCLLVGLATPALAATDTLFAAPSALGAADCSSPANACSIATAVTNANAEPVSDSVVIKLASGNYLLPTPTPTALPITFAGPSLTIEAESGTPTLDGEKATRLLSIGSTSNVTIDGLEIEFGSAAGQGGGIDNSGTLTVKNSTFSSNSAGNGGGIADEAGGTLTVQNSTFSHNTTTGVGGGAILSFGTTTVERSALTNNTAPTNGGGINVQPAGTVTVASSTIAGNVTPGLGGAFSNLGHLTVEASTITNNTGGSGSVIGTSSATNTKFAADIIAAQSSGGACSPANSAITDDGYNLDEDGTCISSTSPGTGSHNGTTADGSSTYGAVLDAYLADGLAHNGGPTKTAALLNSPSPSQTVADPAVAFVPASFSLPAPVDGVSAACSVSDQRGVVPAAGSNCDIGAYLLQATTTELTSSAAKVGQNGSVTYTATVTPTPDGGTVSFNDGAGNPATAHCTAQSLTNGTATCTVSYATPGAYPVTATYSGDGALNNYAASASVVPTATTTKVLRATTTVLTSSAAKVGQNAPVTYTATVTPTPDGGTVSFGDGAGNPATAHCTAQSLTPGTARCTVSYPKLGVYPVTATYSGDGNYAASASVVPTATTTTVVDKTRPSAPRNLKGRIHQNTLRLSWKASTDNVGVTSYQILRNGKVIKSTKRGVLSVSLHLHGRGGVYAVRALDAAGNVGRTARKLKVRRVTRPKTGYRIVK